jgi:predicted ABC-type ATPase
VTKNPELIVIAGPNGSGKTSLTDQLQRHTWMEGCLYLNPDRIAQEEFGDWNSPEASLKAAKKAEKLREECLLAKRSVAFETVFSAPDKVDFVRRAAGSGFFIRFFFICTNGPEINAARIAHRSLQGGHTVSLGKVIARYSKSIAQCASVIPFVDRAYIYDNSVEDAAPVLLFRTKKGKVEKRYGKDLNLWAQPIFMISDSR